MRKVRKAILALIFILLIAGGGYHGYQYLQSRKNEGSKENAVYVQSVAEVTGVGQVNGNRYSGVVETQKTEKINPDGEKKISKVYVAEDETVKKDDPLFTYDTASIKLDIQAAELEIERNEATIENDTAQIEQLNKDMEKANASDKLGYAAQIQELQAEIATAEYTIKTKKNEIKSLKATLKNDTVFAPIDGTVTHVGDPQNPNEGYNPDGSESAFITILADGDLRIKGTVSEQSIYNIGEGMPVVIRSRIDETRTWTGVVSAIETQAESSGGDMYYYGEGERASKYPFYVDLDSTEGLLLGQHVLIEPGLNEATRSGMWLSSGWLIQEEESSYVWAAREGGRLEKRRVVLGDYDPDTDEWQISSGLDTGDYIAWPSVDCKEGAATTTEYVFSEEEMMDPGMPGEGDYQGDYQGDFEGGNEGMWDGDGYDALPEGEDYEGAIMGEGLELGLDGEPVTEEVEPEG